MTTVRRRNGKTIKVVTSVDQSNIISSSDAEMDARAVEAVKTAIEKADQMVPEKVPLLNIWIYNVIISHWEILRD